MLCPHCNVDLAMSDRQGIEIDYCPRCRGVWLDKGELDKIIERSLRDFGQPRAAEAVAPPRPAQGWTHDDDRVSHQKYRRKKSFLEDVFDFD